MRYILGKSGGRNLVAVGLNPSTATRERSDATVAKVERVARHSGFDGFVMTNLYPLRATHPADLPLIADRRLLRVNLEQVLTLLRQQPGLSLWACWGGAITTRPYLADTMRALVRHVQRLDAQWFTYGPRLKAGHPRHPSRVSYTWRLAPFDAAEYARLYT